MEKLALFFLIFLGTLSLTAQHDDHSHPSDDSMEEVTTEGHETDHDSHGDDTHDDGHGSHDEHAEFDPAATAFHHISDANVLTILDRWRIPLPMILYLKGEGWKTFSSSKFHAGHHDNGHQAYDGFVLYEGNVHRVTNPDFPMGVQEISGFHHGTGISEEGVEEEFITCDHDGHTYQIEPKSTLDGGLMGGATSSFMDFSITKNVLTMIIVSILLGWLFISAARQYEKRDGKAPKGLQSLLETLVEFIRDEIAVPFLGDKYEKYIGLLLALFFFILGLNLWGQIPFFGSPNVSGNLAVTGVLAIIVFLVVNLNGNKHYWQHILWMPGVPIFVKPLMAAIELLSMFIKPITLMLRLAGNISAGHIALIAFVGLIFIFGESGKSIAGSSVGALISIPLTIFMMALELLVAFIQAYVFTILTASYLGAAIEEEHH